MNKRRASMTNDALAAAKAQNALAHRIRRTSETMEQTQERQRVVAQRNREARHPRNFENVGIIDLNHFDELRGGFG